ncbi:MAG: SRPBCC family protein [Flavobacteriales bacterium]|nr:SRPBCC family protein [Flavobacteriales bacterium]
MPHIRLQTIIKAPVERVFDLSRSIDLHQISTSNTDETAISGVVSGLIDLNETVTWKAKHFGIYQHLTSRITELQFPHFFVDEMEKGIFKSLYHKHLFEDNNGSCVMTDYFDYQAPLGILGRLADILFLKKYLTKVLVERNAIIKKYAEGNDWHEIIQREKTIRMDPNT